MAALLPFLALALLAQAAANEQAPVEAALESDDQCAAGDMQCALNALQRRGAALAKETAEELDESLEGAEDASESSRRRRTATVPDLTPEGEKKLKKRIMKISNAIKEDFKTLDNLEEEVNVTYKMVSNAPAGGSGWGSDGGSDDGGYRSDRPDDQYPDDSEEGDGRFANWLEVDAEDSTTSARRRHHHAPPPPRMTAIQKMVKTCEKTMHKFWKRTTRLNRLLEWEKMKIQNPGAPDWQEPADMDDDDDDDDQKKTKKKDVDEDQDSFLETEEESGSRRRHKLHAKDINPQDANMGKIVDDLKREVDGADTELKRMKEVADEVRKMAKEAMPSA